MGLLCLARADAATNASASAEAHYQAGLTRQTEAELASDPADARQLYTEAITEYAAAVAAQPDHYSAQVYWAISLTQLALRSTDDEVRNEHFMAAHQRFAAAAQCPGADYVAFEQWSILLHTYFYGLVPTDEQRVTVLKETVDICQRGLELTEEGTARASLEQQLSRAMELWAGLTPDPRERQSLQEQATQRRRAANRAFGAERRYQAGVARQAAAEMAGQAAEARQLYQEAVAEYRAAAAAWPDHYRAQFFWATCLMQWASLAEQPGERVRLALAARERFAAASRCPDATANVFEQWASLLVGTIYSLVSDRAQQQALLEDAAGICRQGLPLATAPTTRAQLERQLGSAIMWQVDFSKDPQQKRALLEEAIKHLRAANQVVTVRQTLYQNGYLGIALLSLGRLIKDPARLREAAVEFEAALEWYPNQVDTVYNLAATSALLGDTEQAGNHLAVVIDHDPQGEYFRMAARDPDLASVRGTASYNAALDRRRRQEAEARARALYDRAVQARQTAETTNDVVAARSYWRATVIFCEQAIELTSDLFAAQALCATALAELGRRPHGDPDQQRRDLEAARRRFAAAARCPQAEPAFYDQWSGFLLDVYQLQLAEPADQERLLQEARQVIEDGIDRVRFTGLRGRLESRLGACLVLLARLSATRTEAIALYAEAVKHFETAAAVETAHRADRSDELWGSALFRVGQASRDKLMIRRGIERFLRSVELAPDDAAARYGLACAYAQLRQFDLATRHLQRSLANDPQGVYQRRAETDPDLRALRQTEAFHRISRPPEPARRPTISER